MPTLWKVPDLELDCDIAVARLEPIGDTVEVVDRLLEIPRMKPYFDTRFADGNVSVIWEVRDCLICFKEEPEFGKPEVFSLQIEKMGFEKDFFRLYVQLFENLGVILLYNKTFIPPKRFRKLI